MTGAAAAHDRGFVNLLELEALARERLPAGVYAYFAGGAADEITLRENRLAWERLPLRPRVLVDVSVRDASLELPGTRLEFPVLVAPMAMQRMAHPDGELATARAAAATGTTMVVSTLATATVEEIRAACGRTPWFQLYVHQDRSITEALLARVEAAGYGAIVLTVDTPVLGRRERDVRGGFAPPPGIVIANAMRGATTRMEGVDDDSALAAYFTARHDASVTWADLAWLRAHTRLPIVLKGVVRGDDARRAVEHGMSGVVVSNHGGRQLDTTLPTTAALPEVAEAVAGCIPVLVDGGIRRGTDVLKALALGARAVMVGRPVLWGLALGGEDGVRRVLALLRDELDLAMALCGAPTLREVTGDLVTQVPGCRSQDAGPSHQP